MKSEKTKVAKTLNKANKAKQTHYLISKNTTGYNNPGNMGLQ